MIVRGLDDSQNATVNELFAQLKAKQRRNMLRAAAYDGKNAARDLGISMPPQMRNITYVLGWTAKPVDLLARRCKLEGFTSPDSDMESLGLTRVLDDNRFLVEAGQGATSSLIHATAFLVTTRGGDGEPAVMHTFRDALDATGMWDVRQRRLSSFLSVTKRDERGEPVEANLYLPGRNIQLAKDGGWSAVVNTSSLDYVPVEPLVFKPRLGRPFGSSRITRPMLSLVAQAMRTLGRSESQAEIFSLPQRYAMGAEASMFQDASGNPIPRWQVLLGGVWWAGLNSEGKAPEVGQFSQASQQPHIEHLDMLAEQFAGEASIPVTSLGVNPQSNPTSADAYLASREDLISEAEGADDEWGVAFSRAQLTATRYLGTYSPTLRISAKWRNPRHESRAAVADAGMKQLTAVPWLADTEVGLELLGLTKEQIDRALAERARAQGRATLSALLSGGVTADAVAE